MERRQLVFFLTVVDEGSFSAAARRLGYSQPSVSQAIRELERELGTALFTRQRGAVVTPAGEALTGPARHALRALTNASAAIDSVTDLVTGVLDMGVVSGLAIHPLVPLVAAFRQRHPKVRIRAQVVAADADGFAVIDRGEAELILHDHPALVGGYREVPLGTRDSVAIFSPDFEDIPDGPVALADLSRFPVITPPAPGQSIRRRLNEMLAQEGLPPYQAITEAPHHALIPLVLENAGMTLVPEYEGRLATALGAVIRPLDFELCRSFALYGGPDALSPAAEAFIAIAVGASE